MTPSIRADELCYLTVRTVAASVWLCPYARRFRRFSDRKFSDKLDGAAFDVDI
jgi:hypothetical protein